MKIGVLAVQGAFIEHETMIKKLGASCTEIRQKSDLDSIDGIILPGGESTVQGKLLRNLDMLETLQTKISQGLPVLATCAGLILLAENIENDETRHISTLPVTVKRNAYGRQLGSFQTIGTVGNIENFPMTFIRAPYITDTAEEVTILSAIDSKIVGVRYQNQIALSFHPEITEDLRIHKLFLEIVQNHKEGK